MTTLQMTDKAQLQHWQALLDSAGEGIWGLDLQGRCTFANWMTLKTFGFTRDEMVGNEMHALVCRQSSGDRVASHKDWPVHQVLSKKAAFRQMTDTMFRKDGSSFVAEIAAEPVMADGELMGAVITFREMTAIMQQHKELQEERRLIERQRAVLNTVIENIPHGMYIATPNEKMQTNTLARKMGGEEFPRELHTLSQALAGKSSTETARVEEHWIQSRSAPIYLHGAVIGGVAVNTDVTKERLQDEILRRSEKLAAVGQLASLIAHEINNPLESITNLLYLIQRSGSMEDVQRYSMMAQDELSRVSAITLQTLRFHRQQNHTVRLDVAELLRALMTLYTGRMQQKSIVPEMTFYVAPRVVAMEGEVRQVLNNLVRNALDAMPHGGRLILRVHPETDRHSGCRGVRVTVADTGEGIGPGIRGHLFEAFHTTKEQTGTGLGLWMSKGIVERHGGRISVRSQCGAGTVFAVWLPMDSGVSLTARAN